MRTTYRTRFVSLAVLALAAAGCEIVADIDRTKIDSGVDYDSGSYDAQFPDAKAAPDVNVPDAQDAGVDATLSDGEAGPPGTDAGPDTSVPDAGDTGTPDAHDANVPDTNVPDTNVPDTNVPDTNVPDTDVPDTNVPD